MELGPTATDRHGVWVLSEPLSRMRFVNNVRYFTGEVIPPKRSPRRNKVIEMNMAKTNSTKKYTSFAFVTMIETRSIYFGEGLFTCYDRNYVLK